MSEPNWSLETDADLLLYMALREDDALLARKAWETFYLRHVEYLYGACRSNARLLGGEQGVADLVQDTFRRAFEMAHTFAAADGMKDPDDLRLWTRAWLGAIAASLVKSILRNGHRLPTASLDQDHWQDIAERITDPPDDERTDAQSVIRMRQAVESLPERQQTVVLARMQWYDPAKERQRLPNAVAADLATTLETTPENLRKMYERALRQLKEQFPNMVSVSQKGR
jgi:RNA polymerase sigma factor (sigma-70 family)